MGERAPRGGQRQRAVDRVDRQGTEFAQLIGRRNEVVPLVIEHTTEARPENDAAHTAHEAADLIFHTLVGLEAAGVPIDDVFAQLRKRFGISGLDEKASRRR